MAAPDAHQLEWRNEQLVHYTRRVLLGLTTAERGLLVDRVLEQFAG